MTLVAAVAAPVHADELRLDRTPDQTRLVRTAETGEPTVVAAWPDTPDATWVIDLLPWPPDGTLRAVRHEPPPASPCTADLPPIDAHLWDENAAAFVRAPAPPEPLEGARARVARVDPSHDAAQPFRDPTLAGTVRAASGVPGRAFAPVDALARATSARWSPARPGPDASLLVRTAAGLPADTLVLGLPDGAAELLVELQTADGSALARLPGGGLWRVALPSAGPCAWVTVHARAGAPAPVVTMARLESDLARALDAPTPLDAPTLTAFADALQSHPAPLGVDVVSLLRARWPVDTEAFVALASTMEGPARDALLEALLDTPVPASTWATLDPSAQERLVTRARLRPLTPFDDNAALLIADDPSATPSLRTLAFDRALAAQDASALWVLSQVDLRDPHDRERIFAWLTAVPEGSLAELAALALMDHDREARPGTDDDDAGHADRVALEAMLVRGEPLTHPAWPDRLLTAFDSPVGTVARIAIHVGPLLDPPADAVNARTDELRRTDPHPRIRAAAARAQLARLPHGDAARREIWDAALSDRSPDARLELASRCDEDVDASILTVRLRDETWPEILAPLARCALARHDDALDEQVLVVIPRLLREDLLVMRRGAGLDTPQRTALVHAMDAALAASAPRAPTATDDGTDGGAEPETRDTTDDGAAEEADALP